MLDIDPALQDMMFDAGIDQRRKALPADFYEPHKLSTRGPRAGMSSGQWQCHNSLHPIRVAAPGNGWGGTVMMGYEVDAWCRHTNRWQITPAGPVQCVWFCPEFRQLALMMAELRENCFGPIPVMKESGFGGPHMEWPDKSKLFFASYDRSWSHLQGIPLDLALFDEEPPVQLWREMLQRRRTKRKTKFMCKATQTMSDGWMGGDELYGKWLEFHAARGLTEDQAMDAQLHGDIWCWPKGGIMDNPGADQADVDWYLNRTWPSDKERNVRLYGGFQSWAGDPVFDPAGVERLRQRMEELGREFGPGLVGSFEIDRRVASRPVVLERRK